MNKKAEIPEAIRHQRPEINAIDQALEQFREGQTITAKCPHCGEKLIVTETPVGSLHVTCAEGCIKFRVRRAAN